MKVEGVSVGIRLDTGPITLLDPVAAARKQGKESLFRRRC